MQTTTSVCTVYVLVDAFPHLNTLHEVKPCHQSESKQAAMHSCQYLDTRRDLP